MTASQIEPRLYSVSIFKFSSHNGKWGTLNKTSYSKKATLLLTGMHKIETVDSFFIEILKVLIAEGAGKVWFVKL